MARFISVVTALLLIGALPLLPADDAAASVITAPNTFRVVVYPDSQFASMTDAGGELINAQTDWIIDNAAATNTAFVTHVGDMVQNPDVAAEWDRFEPAFDAFEVAGIPHGASPGNHDLTAAEVEYDRRFPLSRLQAHPWFGDNHDAEATRSTWQQVSVDGHDLLFLHIRHLRASFGAVEPVIDWANTVLAAHPDHLVFVTTHEFTNGDGSILMPALRDVLDDHCNVAAVFSGHRPGESAHGTFTDACGRSVHHLLTNYQSTGAGGDGFLRTLDINPITLVADSSVYSPAIDVVRDGATEAFTFQLAPLPVVMGDANCSRNTDIADALAIAQLTVQTRTATASCPLADPAMEVNGVAADVDGDGAPTIVDALLIARCTVGLSNVACPAPAPS